MRIIVLGAGAVGGFFGAKWAAAGRDVTFLVREATQAALDASGLTVAGAGQDVHVTPSTITASKLEQPYDVIFLTVPGDALDSAIATLGPAVGQGTVMLSALNGIQHFRVLRERFGDAVALGSVAKCVTAQTAPGRIAAYAPLAQLTFGPWHGSAGDALRSIETLLNAGGVEARLSSDIQSEVYEKWLMMAALGAANSALDGDVGAINAEPYGAWAIQEILREGAAALHEIGMAARSDVVEAMSRMMADPASKQTSSLYRNMRAGRPIELQPILGDLLDRVADHGTYPLLSAAYARLAIYARVDRTASPGTRSATS